MHWHDDNFSNKLIKKYSNLYVFIKLQVSTKRYSVMFLFIINSYLGDKNNTTLVLQYSYTKKFSRKLASSDNCDEHPTFQIWFVFFCVFFVNAYTAQLSSDLGLLVRRTKEMYEMSLLTLNIVNVLLNINIKCTCHMKQLFQFCVWFTTC